MSAHTLASCKASHIALLQFSNSVHAEIWDCYSTVQDAKLHPMVLGGDILTDLPETDNFFEVSTALSLAGCLHCGSLSLFPSVAS